MTAGNVLPCDLDLAPDSDLAADRLSLSNLLLDGRVIKHDREERRTACRFDLAPRAVWQELWPNFGDSLKDQAAAWA